jgi:hypothetical protein
MKEHVASSIVFGLLVACSARERTADSPQAAASPGPASSSDTPIPAAPDSATARWGLHLLQGTWDTMSLGYEAAQANPVLQDAWTTGTQLLLGERDVESCNWPAQVLTLTPAASQQVQQAFGRDTQDRYLMGLDHRAFVVTLDGSYRFGGVILQAESPMGISYAVMHYQWTGTQLVLSFLPSQTFGASPEALARFAEPYVDIRAVFAAAGKLATDE